MTTKDKWFSERFALHGWHSFQRALGGFGGSVFIAGGLPLGLRPVTLHGSAFASMFGCMVLNGPFDLKRT